VTSDEFKTQFPNLYEVLEWVSTDNGMPFADQITLDFIVCKHYEEVASSLSAEEKELMGQGDQEDRDALVQEHNLADFEEWLQDVFDGRYSRQVWQYRH